MTEFMGQPVLQGLEVGLDLATKKPKEKTDREKNFKHYHGMATLTA